MINPGDWSWLGDRLSRCSALLACFGKINKRIQCLQNCIPWILLSFNLPNLQAANPTYQFIELLPVGVVASDSLLLGAKLMTPDFKCSDSYFVHLKIPIAPRCVNLRMPSGEKRPEGQFADSFVSMQGQEVDRQPTQCRYEGSNAKLHKWMPIICALFAPFVYAASFILGWHSLEWFERLWRWWRYGRLTTQAHPQPGAAAVERKEAGHD